MILIIEGSRHLLQLVELMLQLKHEDVRAFSIESTVGAGHHEFREFR